MLESLNPKVLTLALLVTSVSAIMLCIVLWLKLRKIRRELDDQGVRLIQLTNRQQMLKESKAAPPVRQDTSMPSFDQPIAPVQKVSNKKLPEDQRELSLSQDVEHSSGETNIQAMKSDGFAGYSEKTRVAMSHAPIEPSNSVDIEAIIEHHDQADDVYSVATDVKRKHGKSIRLKKQFTIYADFVRKYASYLNEAGMFLPSKKLIPVGTYVDLDFHLEDGSPLIRGKGEVRHVHFDQDSSPHNRQGMDVRFISIDEESQSTIKKVLAGGQ